MDCPVSLTLGIEYLERNASLVYRYAYRCHSAGLPSAPYALLRKLFRRDHLNDLKDESGYVHTDLTGISHALRIVPTSLLRNIQCDLKRGTYAACGRTGMAWLGLQYRQ